jgi:hypothetical protein
LAADLVPAVFALVRRFTALRLAVERATAAFAFACFFAFLRLLAARDGVPFAIRLGGDLRDVAVFFLRPAFLAFFTSSRHSFLSPPLSLEPPGVGGE